MLADLGLLLGGIALAVLGGGLFVRGAVGAATRARVPVALVGTTVAAFATSSPELSVGIQSALNGRTELALGDALGSNVINVTLVLGLVLVGSGMSVARRTVRRDLGVAMVPR